jgi:hypothetical protein
MVIAILMESDVKLSDDLLEAIIDKVGNNKLESLWVGWGLEGSCVCCADAFELNFPDI